MDGEGGGGWLFFPSPSSKLGFKFGECPLSVDVARDEIQEAIWASIGDKAPSLDGFSPYSLDDIGPISMMR